MRFLFCLILAASAFAMADERDEVSPQPSQLAAQPPPGTLVLRINKLDPNDMAVLRVKEKLPEGQKVAPNANFEKVVAQGDNNHLVFVASKDDERDVTSSTPAMRFVGGGGRGFVAGGVGPGGGRWAVAGGGYRGGYGYGGGYRGGYGYGGGYGYRGWGGVAAGYYAGAAAGYYGSGYYGNNYGYGYDNGYGYDQGYGYGDLGYANYGYGYAGGCGYGYCQPYSFAGYYGYSPYYTCADSIYSYSYYGCGMGSCGYRGYY